MNNLLSIVICTYNRAQLLKETIKSILLLEKDARFSYELIIIDNNSTDHTKDTVDSFQNKFNGSLHYIKENRQGKSYALNTAIKASQGDILIFTDDDVLLDPLWLKATYDCFLTHRCDGMGGRVLPIYTSETPQWIKSRATQLSGSIVIYDQGEDLKLYKKNMNPFIGANFAFRKEMFNEFGDFKVDIGPGTRIIVGEDTEFVERLIDNNKKLIYNPQALVHHPIDIKRLNLRHIAKWNMALGRFDALREIKSKESFVYYLGVPRYLFKGVLFDSLRILAHCFEYPKLLNAWRSFFRKIGMIQEYREILKDKSRNA